MFEWVEEGAPGSSNINNISLAQFNVFSGLVVILVTMGVIMKEMMREMMKVIMREFIRVMMRVMMRDVILSL